MSDQTPTGWGLFEWAVPLIGSAFAAALGHLHVRINRVEDRQREDIRDAADSRHEFRNEIQGSVSALEQRTRDDVSQLSNRIDAGFRDVANRLDALLKREH